ncbi:MAG: TIGR03619 family F420-dependent LLM class oxidoreductase [Ilumatobacteraceae bacterium]|nr:MAG: TIGR03619 family F420-dependent LLM class oxidoreductase [Actinomycetota bacterium]
MRFCVAFPMFEADQLLTLAPVAEDAGFDLITVPDSVFYPEQVSADYPYSSDGKRFWAPETPFVEPFVAMAAMAALTSRIGFVTNVLKLPLREPLIVAKQLSSLAVLSGERVELGVGLSWIPEEFRFTNTEMRTRGARLDEQIAILRLVCGGGGPQFVEHHGRHYDFDRLLISPAPTAPVRIHVGGHSEAALRRAADIGDGWISVQVTSDEVARVATELARLRHEAGTAARPGFTMNVLPIDVFDLDGYRRVADVIEGCGMHAVFQAVPWYLSGGDPEDLAVRRDSIARFGDEVIARAV